MATARVRQQRAFFDWRFVAEEQRRVYRLGFILFWSILLYFIFQRYVVGLGIVTDRSMLPILADGHYFLVNRYLYHVTTPARGDIVVFRVVQSKPEEYVKRVIGLSGEVLLIRSGVVYINGRPLAEPYALSHTFPDLGPIRIKEGSYFVMGDNRQESLDSRQFGSVPLREIRGRINPGTLFSFF